MKIFLNGTSYEVPLAYRQQLIARLVEMAETEYAKLDKSWRALANPFSRGLLLMIEKQAAAAHGKEHAMAFRPERKADPNIFLMHVLAAILEKGADSLEIAVDTDERLHTTTALDVSIKSESQTWGLMDPHGNEGERQDNRAQVS